MTAAKKPPTEYTGIHHFNTDHVNVLLDALYRLEEAIDTGKAQPWLRYKDTSLGDPRTYLYTLSVAMDRFNEMLPGPSAFNIAISPNAIFTPKKNKKEN